MMKKVIAALLLLVGTMLGTTTTGTISDPNGQAYTNGTVVAQLVPAAGRPNLSDYTVNGTPFAQNVTGTLDALGAFSITLTDNTTVSPAGSKWKFTLCSKTTAPCTVTNPITISTGAQDVTAVVNAQVVAIKLFAFNQPNYVGSTYSDVEINQPTYGTMYWNTLSNSLRLFDGAIWHDATGATPAGTTPQIQYNNIGAFGAATYLLYGTTLNNVALGSDATLSTTKLAGSAYDDDWGTTANTLLETSRTMSALATSGASIGHLYNLTYTPSGAWNTSTIMGIMNEMEIKPNAFQAGGVYGIYQNIEIDGTGSNGGSGILQGIEVRGSGTTSAINGIDDNATVVGTATVTNLNGLDVRVGVNAAGATATTARSIYIEPPGRTGTITNVYGIYMENQGTGANDYAIRTNTGQVLFGDAVLINGRANTQNLLTIKRFTDAAPAGNFLKFTKADGTVVFSVAADNAGTVTTGTVQANSALNSILGINSTGTGGTVVVQGNSTSGEVELLAKNIVLNTTNQPVEILTGTTGGLLVDGAASGFAPGAGYANIYFDNVLNRTRVTENGGGYRNVTSELTGTATVDLASVASAACSADSADVTVTGAVVGDMVQVTAATALQAGGFLVGRVTAANAARFQFCNLSGGAIDRASDTYTVRTYN